MLETMPTTENFCLRLETTSGSKQQLPYTLILQFPLWIYHHEYNIYSWPAGYATITERHQIKLTQILHSKQKKINANVCIIRKTGRGKSAHRQTNTCQLSTYKYQQKIFILTKSNFKITDEINELFAYEEDKQYDVKKVKKKQQGTTIY